MSDASERLVFVLGNRRRDLLVAGGILAFLLAGSFIMRVYYRITVYEVEVVRVAVDGSRTPIPTPEHIAQLRLWHLTPPELLDTLESQLNLLHQDGRWQRSISDGAHFEWTVRYSYNSPDLDESRVFQFPGAVIGVR